MIGNDMSKRLDIEYVKNIIEGTGQYLWVDGEYRNNLSKLILKDAFGYKYRYGFSHIKHHTVGDGTGLEPFNVANDFVLDNIKLWLQRNKPDIEYVSGDYIGAYDNNLQFYCYICKNNFYSCWNYISNKRRYGCGICGKKILTYERSLEFLYPQLLEEWDYSKNVVSPSQIFSGTHDWAWWICKNCGHKWEAEIKSRTLGNGCSECSKSKGERVISEILNKAQIEYIPQYKFNDCKSNRRLPFDFYIPKYDLCIEYDGILHFEDKFNSPKEFAKVQNRDQIKTKYCEDNNIKLIRIPYWEFENIEKIIENELIL